MANNDFLALDFNKNHINFIEFARKKNKTVIKNIGAKKITPDVDMDSDIKEMLVENNIQAKNVIYLVSEKNVLKKNILLPIFTTDKEVYYRIKNSNTSFFGESVDKIYFDFHTKENKVSNKLETYVIYIKKEVIDKIENTFKRVGLNPLVADSKFHSFLRTNNLVRESFSNKNKIPLLQEEILIYLIKEEKSIKTFFYNKESKIFESAENYTVDELKEKVLSIVEESKFILKENNIQNKLSGFCFLNFEDNEVPDLNDSYLILDPFEDYELKTLSDVNFDYNWLALLGVSQRNNLNY